MGGRGEFQPAADHRALEDGDDGNGAEFDFLEAAMPGTRMKHAGRHVAFGDFAEIEAGGEIGAVAVDHRGAHICRNVGEAGFQRLDRFVVDRVALGLPVEADEEDVAAPLDRERPSRLGFRGRVVAGVRHPRPRSSLRYLLLYVITIFARQAPLRQPARFVRASVARRRTRRVEAQLW